MDSSKMIGGDASHSSVSSINISGKDFEFNYLGSASHSWNNCNISYIRVHETGTLETETDYNSYRWEPQNGKLVSVQDDQFSANVANQVTGSISGTAFTSATFNLNQDVVLMHDKSWVIEWASSGSWSGDRNGSFLMGTILDYKANSAHYIFRQGGSSLIGIGEWTNGIHNNYGLSLADYGIDGTVYHKYAIKNEPIFNNGAWTSNMAYLYVDDVKVGANVSFSLTGDLDELKANVYAKESKIDPVTHTLTVRALYPNHKGAALAGRYATVRLEKQKIDDAIVVPTDAIVPEMGVDKLFLYKSGKAQPVDVVVGMRTEKDVQILKGVSLGDTIIVSGTLQLRTGLPVVLDNVD
jgi:hypothetical protein